MGDKDSHDFIQEYVRYADVIEAPPEAHEAIAIILLATVLNRDVYIQYGELKLSLDFWVVLLSSSGFGRNTLISLARPIIENAGLDIIRDTTWGSKESVYQSFAVNPFGLYIWPEMSSVMKTLSDGRFRGAKEWITDRYDNWDAPHNILYRTTGKSSDTPSIVFEQAPRINLLASSSFDWFVSSLEQEDSTGGFIPRWSMIRLEDPKRLIPKPQQTDKNLIKPLANMLEKVSDIKGIADFTNVEATYASWYEEAHERFSKQPNKALAIPYFNRLRSQVLKLAVIYEASYSQTLSVSPYAMTRAIEFASKIEQTLFSLLPTGLNREGAEVDKIAEKVKAAGASGILQSELTRAFQSVKTRDRNDRILTLLEGKVIYSFPKKTCGRQATIFVHQDWLEDNRKKYPNDKESQ